MKRPVRALQGVVADGGRDGHVAIGRLRLDALVGLARSAFDLHGRLLHNINTPDDYERAIAPPG